MFGMQLGPNVRFLSKLNKETHHMSNKTNFYPKSNNDIQSSFTVKSQMKRITCAYRIFNCFVPPHAVGKLSIVKIKGEGRR